MVVSAVADDADTVGTVLNRPLKPLASTEVVSNTGSAGVVHLSPPPLPVLSPVTRNTNVARLSL
jgi:hypothetical protein